jgi:hypothetical protein
MHAEELDHSIIVRKIGRKFHIYGSEDLALTRRQLSIVLTQLGIAIEEIAFMHLAFHESPEANEAHFGSFGTFLYATRYYVVTK